MRISAAQIQSIKGDIAANINHHIRWVRLAIKNQVDAIFFPELSITNYEPTLAKKLATTANDPRFDVFQELSNQYKITIGIGVPIQSERGILISLLIFQANRARQCYSKQQLHPDEFPYFVAGKKQLVLNIDDFKIAPAICYESLQIEHATHASSLGAQCYLASVAKSQQGINKAILHYPKLAKQQAMLVLLANAIGKSDTFDSRGCSAIWETDGTLMGQLDAQSEGLLIYDTISKKGIAVTL
ncbi:carbon-nitrogen hydrolase family protein [Aureispira anguillae]|uniref:Carbon-nitrogen hydrolase family protein n=1 Tax=Aureispira anguillae TaxID=2864201 RepID=A0A916DUV7_9BACT|nr:carbon-nitrogen hydrolase family protein [Aureispira anguillae]BDS13716.1 carbon-nitrogen hydrolase family protein [Aureispira anguillae]